MTFLRFRTTFILAVAACLAVLGLCSGATAAELLGYWQLEETDVNAEAIDSSGNGWNGIYEVGVDPDMEGAPGFGSGAHFDGISGQIIIGPGDDNGFGDLTSDFSVMAWINPEQFTTKNRVFGSSPHGGAGWGWGTNGDQLEITTWGVKDYDQPVPLELDEWTHAAIVLDEFFEAHFYVNGEFIGTQTHPSEGLPTFNDFSIGFACCGQEYFEGTLDEVAVFSGALTEEQIQNAMNFGVSNFDGAVGALQAGDADQDLKFDQIDLVRVQVAAKYLTGNPATWGEGDWNGAPGGAPGSPPDGDGLFDQLDIISALNANVYLTGPYAALAGPAPPGGDTDEQTSIVYNTSTGELGVNAPASTELTSVNIDSAAAIFTGDAAMNLGGSFDNDSDNNIFKATFGSSFGSLSFGNVAQPGLSQDFVLNDLTVIGSLAGGGDLGDVDLIFVPEPSAMTLMLLATLGAALYGIRRRG